MKKSIFIILTVFIGLLLFNGCVEPEAPQDLTIQQTTELGTTIGSLAEISASDLIEVEGYGIVNGLEGTGSSQCPENVRQYLEKYILRHMPDAKKVGDFLNAPDTAVVVLRALMPTNKNMIFDVKIQALPGTETTSLRGGWLLESDLFQAGRFGIAIKELAKAEGPVFINSIDSTDTDEKAGYILGGGVVLDEYKMKLYLFKQEYSTASRIRNILNRRFGDDMAKAISAGLIELTLPPEYRNQKDRFITLVKSIYLTENQDIIDKRVSSYVKRLAVMDDKEQSEITLEGLGTACLDKLSSLLNSSNPEVQFRAARCMLNLGDPRGLEALIKIIEDKASIYRIKALEAIALTDNKRQAVLSARYLLRDDDFAIRLAAYQTLVKLNDIMVDQTPVGNKFLIEQVPVSKKPSIYVSRSEMPQIVLFGAPLYAKSDIFIQTSDKSVTINAAADDNKISLMRKNPKRPEVVLKLTCSYDVSDIIRTLCEDPVKQTEDAKLGLGVSYSDIIYILERMSEKGAIDADFHAGPLPKID